MRLHPYSQLVIFLVLIAGIFITRDLLFLSAAYLLVLLLLLLVRQLTLHIKMLLIANIPFLLLLLLVYGVILKNHTLPHNQSGLNYSFALFLRITVLTSLFQYIFNVPSDQLLYFFRKLRFKGYLLVIIISSFSVWRDFISRADRIVTARLARGYMKNRHFVNRLRQLPYVIKPLFIGTLMLSLERTASWKQRNLFWEIGQLNPLTIIKNKYSKLFSLTIPLIAAGWLFFIIIKLAR